ncbi:MAG: glycosyl transferase family 2 [Bacteroidales bacterium]
MMDYLYIFTIPELALAGCLFTLFIIQLLYYSVVYLRPYRRRKRKKEQPDAGEQPPVSVIVYAKDESENLQNHLPALLTQDYPQYEVIVINDGSIDESDNVLKRFANDYPHLYHTFIPKESKYLSRRKLSLTLGVKAARYDILIFTEACCRPLGNRWLATMARNYTEKTEIVLGFCAYPVANSFLHRLISYDNLLAGLRYLSAALVNRPYSGDGKNLSYRKDLFYEHKDCNHSLNLPAGDDLFINEAATGENTRAEYHPDSIAVTSPVNGFVEWKELKAALAATRKHYAGNRVAFYKTEQISLALFLSATVAAIIIGGESGNVLLAGFALLLYGILFIVKTVILNKSATALQQKSLAGWLLILEAGLLITNACLHIAFALSRLRRPPRHR